MQKVDDSNLLLIEVKGVYQVQTDPVMMQSQGVVIVQQQVQHGHDVSSSPYTRAVQSPLHNSVWLTCMQLPAEASTSADAYQ